MCFEGAVITDLPETSWYNAVGWVMYDHKEMDHYGPMRP